MVVVVVVVDVLVFLFLWCLRTPYVVMLLVCPANLKQTGQELDQNSVPALQNNSADEIHRLGRNSIKIRYPHFRTTRDPSRVAQGGAQWAQMLSSQQPDRSWTRSKGTPHLAKAGLMRRRQDVFH